LVFPTGIGTIASLEGLNQQHRIDNREPHTAQVGNAPAGLNRQAIDGAGDQARAGERTCE
jgi:hypothetical protein